MTNDTPALRILIVAPIGRDASAIVELLESRGHLARVCSGLTEAGAELEQGAGALLLTEESLQPEQIAALLPSLDRQPAWSELPVIMLMTAGERPAERFDRIAAAAGGITLLERPIGSATLLRSIEVALLSRRRQYQVRDLLEAQRQRETALRDSEERLRRAIAALRDADQRKDTFLATLSHELRNPLAPIRTAAEILASPRLTPKQLRWTQSVIQRQAAHMASLLDDLLELTRITQGKLQLRKQPCSIQDIVEAAVETARPLLEKKRHELRMHVPHDIPRFVADPVRLAQAISNLLTNAAKYTDAGGRIEVSARLDDRLTIAVQDNGIGIPTEQLEGLFTMFSQIPSAIGRSEGGLGVGLALVRGLAELHGGTVEAQSEGAGKGSRFVISLPFEPCAESAQHVQGQSTAAPSGKLRVLIADDNRDAADSLSMLLSMDGHDVRTVYGGHAAIAAIEMFRPDVALLDIGMPEVDGYAAARVIRQAHGDRDIYLIAITGWGQQEDKLRALEAGFAMHVTKPVDPDLLRDLLRSVALSASARAHNADSSSPGRLARIAQPAAADHEPNDGGQRRSN
ncbi:MAG TPA: ATP-binding protein [Steroidobacteraceae bacterium]|jgi:signal transduction histidine kinase/DNA-binding NarL/FixJ family response regulator|nr:ATP-binding protein [Steroidobacteraceae bacterium]